MEVHFHIGMIKANGMESSSAMNVGTNILIGFSSNTKSNQGNGQNQGDYGALPSLWNATDDRDMVDTPLWDAGQGSSMALPPWPDWPR